ncbi:MAG: nucleotidyltransferase family protein [Elusimicrobia bacterium]|nr:nucleotidyltransferase family protein [Elusimicrobiota bacterium]
MNGLERVRKALTRHQHELRTSFGLSGVGVFGSYARKRQGKASDLDLLVDFQRAPGLMGFLALEERLSRILGVKVDLVMKSALKPGIAERVLKEVVYVW